MCIMGPGKSFLKPGKSWKSSENLSLEKCMNPGTNFKRNVGQSVRRINIQIMGVKGLTAQG